MLSADIAPLTTAAAEVTVVRNLQQPLSDSRAADLIEAMACVSVCARVYARVRVSVWVRVYAVGGDTFGSLTRLVEFKKDQLHVVRHAVARGVQQLPAATIAVTDNGVGTGAITVGAGVIGDRRYCRQSARRRPSNANDTATATADPFLLPWLFDNASPARGIPDGSSSRWWWGQCGVCQCVWR